MSVPIVDLYPAAADAAVGPADLLGVRGAEIFAERALANLDSAAREAARGAAGDAPGEPPVFRTSVDENAVAIDAYLRGRGPLSRPGATGFMVRHLDAVLAGHVLVAGEIRNRIPAATIAIGLRHDDAYEACALLVDVLGLAAASVPAGDVHSHLVARRATWYLNSPGASWRVRARRRLFSSIVPLEQAMPRSTSAVLAHAGTHLLDEVHLSGAANTHRNAHRYDGVTVRFVDDDVSSIADRG